MTPQHLSVASLIFFALGAAAAIAGFRIEKFKYKGYQFALVGGGFLAKTASIGMTCAAGSSHFFNSPSDVVSLLAWALSASYLVALAVSAARSLGAIILPFVVLLMAISQFLSKETVDPGISGSIFAVHILSAFMGYGLFLTACGASLLYLAQSRLLKQRAFGSIFRDLPSLERLERLEILCSWMGLAVFSAAIFTGAMMARELNKPFWLEPKFLSAQVTWIIFGALVVGRAIRWLNGKLAAKFVLAGAALVLITFALNHPFGKPTATTNSDKQQQGITETARSTNESHYCGGDA